MSLKGVGYILIISHKYKFIFIKTNKTAGTSIEIALSKFCGPEDIITPISPEDENIREKLGYRGPQNYDGFYNHISAKEIKKNIDSEIWKSYFKFCMERNPWDRFVSFYFYTNRTESRLDINEYVKNDCIYKLRKMGYENYTIDGTVVVDKVCLYEKLERDLQDIANIVRLPEELELPHAKSKYRKDKRHYRELLNDESKQFIEQYFSEEIHLFNYHF